MKKRVGDLKVDPDLIRMRPINTAIISQYRQAARNKAKFPEIIIEKDTNRIVSGNQRHKMYLKEFGEDYEIDVIEKTFANEAEVIKLFAEENNKHGMQLSGYTRKKIIQTLYQLKENPATIAKLMSLSDKKVIELNDAKVIIPGENGSQRTEPVKHGLEHLHGTKMSEEQHEELRVFHRGIPARSQATQLTSWIKNGWIKMSDPGTVSAMLDLYDALVDMLDNAEGGTSTETEEEKAAA